MWTFPVTIADDEVPVHKSKKSVADEEDGNDGADHVKGEGAEVDPGRLDGGVAGDEDVGRVADGGGGAADVGEDDVGDEDAYGVDGDGLAELDDDWGHEEDGGDVVEDGGDGGREEAEQGQQGPHAALGHLEGPESEVVEDTRLGQYRDLNDNDGVLLKSTAKRSMNEAFYHYHHGEE